MQEVKESLDNMGNTNDITNMLLSIVYWLGVAVVILFVIYVIYALTVRKRNKERGIDNDNDDFLDN